jgi:hypothetical protein
MVRRVGLPELLDSRLDALKRARPYQDSDHVLNIAYNVLCGGHVLQDLDQLEACAREQLFEAIVDSSLLAKQTQNARRQRGGERLERLERRVIRRAHAASPVCWSFNGPAQGSGSRRSARARRSTASVAGWGDFVPRKAAAIVRGSRSLTAAICMHSRRVGPVAALDMGKLRRKGVAADGYAPAGAPSDGYGGPWSARLELRCLARGGSSPRGYGATRRTAIQSMGLVRTNAKARAIAPNPRRSPTFQRS